MRRWWCRRYHILADHWTTWRGHEVWCHHCGRRF